MIRTIKVDLNAAYPNMPLDPFQIFNGSSMAVVILNVPRIIQKVRIVVKNVAGAIVQKDAERSGSSWCAIVPGTSFSVCGTVELGVKIEGFDERQNKYVMGAANLVVLQDNGTVAPAVPGGGDVRHADFEDLTEDTVTVGELLRRLKGTFAALLLSACCILPADAGVHTAPLKNIPGACPVVTNVEFSAEDVGVGDYSNVSNRAMKAVQSESVYTKSEIDGTSVTNGGAVSVFTEWRDATRVNLGYNASANIDGVSVGRSASSGLYGVSVGKSASSGANGVSVGVSSGSSGSAVAVGHGAAASAQESVAIGPTAKVNQNDVGATVIGTRTDGDKLQSHGSHTFTIGAETLDDVYLQDRKVSDAVEDVVIDKAATKADVQTLNIGYARLYNFNTGATNANFTATNYPPTKAEADARCHWKPEPGMDFSTVPASLQLNEKRDGEWRTVVDTRDWTVWYYKFKEVQLTNEIARLRAENEVLSNKVESAKAWGGRTANGIENQFDDTVVVDRPNMWLMADYEWQKCVSGSNQCFVLRAKNVALSGGANTNGFLEVCDAFGKPYMRINKSSEMFADPVFSEIRFDQDEGAWYVVYSNSAKPTKGGANVVIQGDGSGKFILYGEDEEDCPAVITWPNVPESRAGHWIMKAVPKPVNGVIPDKMFFGAEIRIPGSDYVEYLKEASFGAGIRFGANVYDPVESGDQLIWRKRQ